MKKIITALCIFVLASAAAVAQNPYRGEVRVGFGESVKTGDIVKLRAEIDLSGFAMGPNNTITFTPALRSLDGSRELKFETVTLAGKRRDKANRRADYFGGGRENTGNYTVWGRPRNTETIPVEYEIPFEKWMRNSQMVVVERTSGCCNDGLLYADGQGFKLYAGDPFRFAEPYVPEFAVSYITPPVEDIKIQSDTYSARLQFQVNRSELLRGFGDNARILAEADGMIDRARRDTLLTVRRIMVRGYASPEGNEASNLRLSQDRAGAFVTYLHSRHNYYKADNMITAEGLGEDWAGLRKAVEAASWFQDKDHVLDILDNTYDNLKRKNALKALSGGATYRMLLNELYPPLRRNEYTIEYEVRGFNADEAEAIFRTRPKLLSLNEMFMVANRYDRNSEEFRNVFDVAATLYPDSPVAQVNVAATEIGNGSYASAIKRLEKIDAPEALNNLGVAYWHSGNYELAGECLRKSAAAGDSLAKENLAEFTKWSEDRNQ